MMLPLPAHDQQKTWTRDISRGPSPAAAMNQTQDRPVMCRARLFGFLSHNTTGRGFGPGTLNSHRLCLLPSRRRVSPLALLLPVNRGTRQSIRATGFPSDPAQSLPNQQRFQALADRYHFLRRLPCSPSSDGFKTIGKALTHGEISFASGANAND